MGLVEHAPLWLVWPGLSLALFGAMVLGKVTRRFIRGKDARDGETHGFLLSAALALLGLLIAFTFSMASARFDARRGALLDEANAVGTTYLRFQIPEEPYRGTLSKEMLSYLEARHAFFAAGSDLAAVDRADAATGAVQNRIWKTLTDWIHSHPGSTATASLLQTTNDMFDLAASDRVVRETRVPLTIVRAIAIYSLIAAFLLGQSYVAKRENNPFAAVSVFILVALSIALILDLDRPASGTITISTTPFDRAATAIRAMEPGPHPQTAER